MTDDGGRALLAARVREIPAALARTVARAVPDLALGATPVRRVVATGIGSSAAHATLLAHVLRDAGRDATAVPLSSFLAPAPDRPDDVLVVFSQGLSPNARLALDGGRWRRVVLVTAVTRDDVLAPLRARGVAVHTIDGEDEFGTLVRVIGPMTGYAGALAVAHALGGPPLPSLDGVTTSAAAPQIVPELLDTPLAFVTTGTYGALVANLQYKVMEGLLRPMPPLWDALHLAHGPFQQSFSDRATFLALTRPDAPGEEEVLDRFATMLDPARHALVRLPASAGGVTALFQHEAMLNEILLRQLAACDVDQTRWPGQGRDAPLYGLRQAPADARLARLTWPELDARRPRIAIVPLGATEQHGPHLPYATDTLIADALAVRLGSRVPDAVALPALPVGCSVEHAGFPGTVDVSAATLEAVVVDCVRALARHGVTRAFVFTAHGGNAAPLRALAPRLRQLVPDVETIVFADLGAVMCALHAVAAAHGVAPETAGHHAGEVETSIMLHLHPELVRCDAFAAGYVEPTEDPQSLFYPDLRRVAPSGTVGDPRGAAAVRGAQYLTAWVALLESALRAE